MDEKEKQSAGDQPVESVESPPKVIAPTEDANTQVDALKQHHLQSLASQVGQGNSNNSSGTFGDGGEQMKIFVTNANVTYHTRHARRIYVGGIPPNYSDEEELRNFFNKVISKGLGVENDHSFVISVYMNQKKCYAFVELNSIELTTACLEMDGIIFKKVTLKIYRANEYRPDLVPPTKYLKLDLTGWSFGLATGAGANANGNGANTAVATPAVFHRATSAVGMNQPPNAAAGWAAEEPQAPASLNDCIASLIQFINIASIEPGSVAIVGFPYEGGSSKAHMRNAPQRGLGTSAAPACLRKCLTSYTGAMIYNAELGLDLSLQPVMDVGDVLAGQSRSETKALLSTTVSELLLRGSVPFLVGGSREQSYYTAVGLVAATGVCVGVMNVSAQVDSRLLDCAEFCTPPGMQQQQASGRSGVSPARAQNCYGRYVQFGAQGAQCNAETVRSVTERGGHIFWLHKDLRTASTESIAVAQFHRALRNLDACVLHDQQRKGLNTAVLRNAYPQAFIMVTIDCGALAGMFNPLAGSSHSSVGLTAEEVLEIAYIAGSHPNVALVEVTEFKPDMESDSRLNMFLADLFYKFTLGVASRTQALRGGALGAGAIALGNGVGSGSLSPTAASPSAVSGGAHGQYGGRPAPIVTGPNAKLAQGQRYSSSRDPAIILQQQMMQQQAQAQHHAQQPQGPQPAVPGRVPYTPQQLQVQQQQQVMMARAAQAQAQAQAQQQQHQQHTRPFPGMNDSPLSSAQNSVRTHQSQSQHSSPIPPGQAQGISSVPRAQSHQGYYNSNLDDTLSLSGNSGGADFGLAGGLQALQVSQGQQPSPVQNGLHPGVRGADEDSGGSRGVPNRPHPLFTPQTSNSTLDSSMMFSHQNSTGTTVSSQGSFYRQLGTTSFASSFLNPGANAFQSDPASAANKWSNYQSNSASLSTPTSAGTQSTAVPAFPHSEWSPAAQHQHQQQADAASGRYSLYSNSTSSLSLGIPSVPSVPSTAQSTPHNATHNAKHASHHGHGGFSSQYGGLGGSSYRAGSLGDLAAPYDDMDKLIGVTNLGHIPSFDDPLDPQYQED